MPNLQNILSCLQRPEILVEAARHGTAHYQRRRDLRRMLRVAIPATPERALAKLLPIEAELEMRRTTNARGYSLTRHVDILCAVIAEARALGRA